jgi:hypothetical protein
MRWRDVSGLTAFALVALITVAWWGLALWPLGNDAPAWLARTQYVCFGTQPDGLPDASGWLALILQPALMLCYVVSARWPERELDVRCSPASQRACWLASVRRESGW